MTKGKDVGTFMHDRIPLAIARALAGEVIF